jgi:uncharacterized repeat protein (TIGR01451 family)
MSTLNSIGLRDSRGLITVHAAGRGNPWINLGDGRDVPTGYSGAAKLQRVLEQNLAPPRALASADFDEDGVPDLIGGYAGPGGGIITLHRGNVDSIYPNAPEAQQRKANAAYTESPFLSPAHVFEVAEAADFVGAGDFDADSHWDVVAAARGGNALWFLSGDGHGSFGAARRIDLPGRVTTLATGEINRADGLTDVVVGVAAADGPKAVVFESPDGALRGKPEAYALPADATAMALGRLDDDYTVDLAVGAGSDLIVVYGRDRKLSLDEIRQAEVPEAKIGQRAFPFAIKSAAIGDFNGDHRTGLSLLSDDGAVYLLSGGQATGEKSNRSDRVEDWKSEVLARGPWPEATQLVCSLVSSIPVDNLVVVDPANHKLHIVAVSADRRLQGAQLTSPDVEGEPMAVLPMRLNRDALSDLVILRNGQSAPTMAMTQPLATFAVTNTSDDGPGSLRQAILDANANAGLDTINFSIGTGLQTINVGSTTSVALPAITSPVIIDGTTQPGYAGSPLIELNGTSAGSSQNGLFITAGSSTIKGLAINRFDGLGIRLESGENVIEGNYIGTDVSGTVDLGNRLGGVFIVDGPNNTIGGTAAGARNIISGNDSFGISIQGNFGPGNLMQGNYIGTNIDGTAGLGNSGVGVGISAQNNTIGGTVAGARNVISGNAGGIDMGNSAATGNLVQGNYIGTDINGTADLSNTNNGVSIRDAGNNTIGGTDAGARNVISGNDAYGIGIIGSGVTGNLVQGNYIGTDINGIADLGNSADGVFLDNVANNNNTIGGTAAGARNVISGNNRFGIEFFGAGGNVVQGNYIGTDINGTADLGNSAGGVGIGAGSGNNTIGGTNAGASNIISGNDSDGIFGGHGVLVDGVGNAVLSNAIFSNAGLGIAFSNGGVTVNDPCDPDTGPNNLQNFPVLTSASTTSIQGALSSTANSTFTIQFFSNTSCDPSGNGEGQTLVGSMTVTTDASCNASFTFPASLSPGQVITATATSPTNDTSEFSPCLAVTGAPDADLSVTKTDSPDPVIRGNNITYTVIVTNNGPSSATNVSLSDVVPSNTKFVSNSGAAGWSCTNPPVKGMGTGTITCTTSSLASGTSVTFTIVVAVKSSTREGTTITNTATVSSSTSDPNPGNNSATATTTVIRK